MTALPAPPLIPGEVLTSAEVAAQFRVDAKTVTRWDRAGVFREGTVFRTPGGHRRYRSEGVIELLNGGQR